MRMSIFREFRYCPRCRAELTRNENYVKCGKCGFTLYDNPRPITILLLQNTNDEYLLYRRAEEPNAGMLDLPGGFVMDGESLLDGARRELKEEVGIEAGSLTYYGSYPDTYPYKGVSYAILGVVFTGRIGDGQALKPTEELTEYMFRKLADIPIEDFAFPSMQQLFRDLQAA